MNRPAPVISVITITWNDLEGLTLATESVRAQKYENIEHVIVDGGSDDGTGEWLLNYSPPYESSWVSEPDRGIFDAMNKGVAKSHGDVVVFMNAGDAFG